MQTSNDFWCIFGCVSDQTLLLLFEACQLSLSNLSEMNRQNPIGLPSFFLTPPCNHPLTLTSLMTDRLLAAFPVLLGLPLALSHSSTHLVFLAAGHYVCSPPRRFCHRRVEETCLRGLVLDCFPFFFFLVRLLRSCEWVMRNTGELSSVLVPSSECKKQEMTEDKKKT